MNLPKKRSVSKANLEAKAAEIDGMFPFEKLPPDLIVKIFLESEFTVKELHTLCNLSRRLQQVCQNRKIWDEIFFRKIMNMELPMNVAKRTNTLPELMEELRSTNKYKLWFSITEYESFVKFIAFSFVGVFKKFDAKRFGMSIFNLKLQKKLNIGFNKEKSDYKIYIRGFDHEHDCGYKDCLFEKMYIMAKKLGLNVYTSSTGIEAQTFNTKTYMLFFCNLIENGWRVGKNSTPSTLNNIPLLKCSICSSVTDLKKCRCPCNAIFCSKNCQSKTH